MVVLYFIMTWIFLGLVGTCITAYRFSRAYKHESFWGHFKGLSLLIFTGPVAILLSVFTQL